MDDVAVGVTALGASAGGLSSLADPALDPLFWQAHRIGEPSAWWRHVPFAHWIMNACQPDLFVELGTHAGVSYSAFCHAVQQAGLPTRCWAVDTWIGDHQAGTYDDSVFNSLLAFNEAQFSPFSSLLRNTFDDALPRFENGSIDLLHIDGLHTYEAVHHDFEAWLPKLSDRAVVLLHDIHVRDGDFGVWRLMSELRDRYPTFEFLHGYGLGVVGVGGKLPPAVIPLLQRHDPVMVARIRQRFAWVGERWLSETRERLIAQDYAPRLALAAQSAEAARAETAQAAAELARQRTEAEQAVRHAEAASEAARLEAAKASEAARRGAEEVDRAARAHGMAEQRRGEAEAARALAAHRAERAQREAQAERKNLQAELAVAQARVAGVQRDLDLALIRQAQFEASTSWRLTRPVRKIGRAMPLTAKRALRGAAKVAWWSATLSLRRRLAARRAMIRMMPAQAALPPPAQNQAVALPSPMMAAADVRPMRIVYVSGEFNTPGHRYRVARPATAARLLGAQVTVLPMDQLQAQLDVIACADVLVLWRTPWSDAVPAAVATARKAGVRIVFDVDDLMIDPTLASNEIIDGIRSQNFAAPEVAAHFGRVRQTMLSADICVASSEELVEHMRLAWMPARLLLNGFDHETLMASRLAARAWARVRDGLVRIGYAGGSRTHQRDFAICAGAVAEVLRAHPDVRLVLFCTAGLRLLDIEEFPEMQGLEAQIEWRELVPLERLPEEMARFDINLAPLEIGNPFCEAKSELKYFEAALVDVPTVASATGPYKRAMRSGETGLLAETIDDWRRSLGRLVADPGLRKRLAAAAELDTVWTFGPERRLQEVGALLDIVAGGRRGGEAFERAILRAAAAPRGARPMAPHVPAHEVLFDADSLGVAKVTVIVPLYNYAGTVQEALDSVVRQTLPKLDLIIVDDVSTDDSLAVAMRWAEANRARFNRLRVARNGANAGLAFTRNLGFALADTPWVLPLDADNRLAPDCVAACLGVAEASGAAFVYPVIRQFGEGSEVMGVSPYDPVRLCNGNYIDAMALIARAAWAGVGGYDHVVGGWEDLDLWCRFAEHGLRGEQAPGAPLAEYRVHQTSMIRSAIASAERIDTMITDMQRRHPWLTMVWPLPGVPRPSGRRGALVKPAIITSEGRGIDRILPVLRCPTSGGRLSLVADGTALVSESGTLWPLVNGRPNLFPGLGEPALHPDSHVSNPLPEKARALTRAAGGLVLHLSAGGSAERFDNVIEAEAAVFRHTDVLADAHHLPFADGTFEAVIAMNAFEHYRNPPQAAQEIMRVLAPGGRVLIRTAFLQPEHEAPWHFYNCTRYGLEAWFEQFETEELTVSDNFHPGHSIAWLASECEAALRSARSAKAAEQFARTALGDLVALWRMPEAARPQHAVPAWSDLAALPQDAQQKIAAGFEFLGRKPLETAPPALPGPG